MSKRLKTALLICMLFCLTLFGAVFAACSPTEDDPDPENPGTEEPGENPGNPGEDPGENPEPTEGTYTVTVTDENGDPVPNLMIQMCVVGEGGLCTPAVTNANGVATFDLDAGDYHIQVTDWDAILADHPDATYEVVDTTDGVYTYTLVINYSGTEPDDPDEPDVPEMPEGNYGTPVIAYMQDYSGTGLPTVTEITMYFVENAGTYDVWAPDSNEVYVTFQTLISGKYNISLSLDDGQTAVIKEYAPYNNGTNMFYKSQISEGDNTTSIDFEITDAYVSDMGSSYHTFGIAVTDGTPAQVQIVVTRTGDPTPPPEEIDAGVVEAEQVLAEVYGEQEGVRIPVDAITPETVVLGSDGFYHVGSETGPVLVAKLIGGNRFLFDGTDLIDVESGGNRLLHPVILDQEANTRTSYDYTEFVAAYSDVCNADGVVPVTEELADFLKLYASQAGYPVAPEDPAGEASEGNGWLLFCYYYQTSVSEFVEGNGTQASPYVVNTDGIYSVTVSADQTTYVFIEGFASWVVSADAIETDGRYVSINGDRLNSDFTVTTIPVEAYDSYGYVLEIIYTPSMPDEAQTYEVEFMVEEEPTFGTENNPYEVALGDNYISTYDGVFYITFTAPYDATYIFDTNGEGIIANGSDAYDHFEENYIELELTAGSSYTYMLYGPGYESTGFSFTLNISVMATELEGSGTEADPYVIPELGLYYLNVPAGNTAVYYSLEIGSDPLYIYTADDDYQYESVSYNNQSALYLGGFYTLTGNDEVFSLSSAEGYTIPVAVTEAPVGSQYNPVRMISAGSFLVSAEYGTVGMYMSFTAPADGLYTIYSDADVAYLSVIDGFNYGLGEEGFEYSFTATEGETYRFVMMGETPNSISYTATIVAGERPVSHDYTSSVETSAAAGSNGVAWTFTATEDGEYSITNGALASGHDVHLRLTEGGSALTSYDLPYVISLRAEESVTLWVDAYTYSWDTSESTFYDETVTMYVDRIGEWQESSAVEEDTPEGTAVTMGSNTCDVYASDYSDDGSGWGTAFVFTATDAGMYSFQLSTTASGDLTLVFDLDSSYPEQCYDFPYEVYLEAGESFEFCIYIFDMNAWTALDGTVSLTITMA